jgi:hypothetical protein
MPECVRAAVSRAGSRTGGRGGWVLVRVAEVHFVKIVQGGIWGDGLVVGEVLERLVGGSVGVGVIVGGAVVDGADAADSLCVRFPILAG